MAETQQENTTEAYMEGCLNENGDSVELYIPRKCSWTNKILGAKDRASIQFSVAKVKILNLTWLITNLRLTRTESMLRERTPKPSACPVLLDKKVKVPLVLKKC